MENTEPIDDITEVTNSVSQGPVAQTGESVLLEAPGFSIEPDT
jgi:hypothetical protein